MPKENPYKDSGDYRQTPEFITFQANKDPYQSYIDFFNTDRYKRECRENARYDAWKSGFTAGRKHALRLKKLKAEDVEYDIYANLADELGY